MPRLPPEPEAAVLRSTSMGYAVPRFQDHDDTPSEDHCVRLDGLTWGDYQRVLEMRGDRSAPRLTYLEGLLEIMSPSRNHEDLKSLVGRLVEAWCLEHDLRFRTLGSWTLENEERERAAEPDECYIFGDQDADRPHLAIEVVWTSGRIDKLEVYRYLGVREVWYWRRGTLQPYALRGDRYEPIERSEVLPDLDLAQLVSFMDRETTFDAIRDYRAALRG